MDERARLIVVAGFVAAIGLAGVGAGFVNGDAAVYAAQGWAGDLSERAVHVGWIAIAVALSPLGSALPAAMDLVNVGAGVLLVVAAAAVARRRGGRGDVAAIGAAAAVLPWVSWAEVDVPWAALLVAAIAVEARWGAAALVIAAVSISPTALLALPWVAAERREPWPLVAGAVAVGLLTIGTAGDWWTGPRGVLTADPWPTDRWLRQVGLLPLLVGAVARPWPVLLAFPLLWAPPDTPAWLVPAVGLAIAASGLPWRAVPVLLGLALVPAATAWRANHDRIAAEDALIREVIADLGPRDGLVARWSWGARASVLATGEPYGLLWRVPDGFVADQAERWCSRVPAAIVVLPPDAAPTDPSAGCPR